MTRKSLLNQLCLRITDLRMIPWYNFVQPEEVESEMWTGLHQCYVEERGYGPSAIDRAMTHTFMLHLDHERRFAMSQLGLDCSTFSTEHCANVSRAIDCAVKHFDSFRTPSESVLEMVDNPDLIGLSLTSTSVDYVSILPDIQQQYTEAPMSTNPIETDSFETTLAVKTDKTNVPSDISDPIVVDDDFDDENGQVQEDLMETARQLWKERRKLSGTQPRTYSAKRIRKLNIHAVSEERSMVTKKRRS